MCVGSSKWWGLGRLSRVGRLRRAGREGLGRTGIHCRGEQRGELGMRRSVQGSSNTGSILLSSLASLPQITYLLRECSQEKVVLDWEKAEGKGVISGKVPQTAAFA